MVSSTAQPRAGSPSGARARSGRLYRGDPGMWSWVVHRITGVLTFFFLFAHVLDTAMVRVSPETYDSTVALYKNPVVNLMEVALVGAVLYHALNGIRIMLIDFWSKGPKYQRHMLWAELVLWVLVMIPTAIAMLWITVSQLLGGTA